MLQNLFLTESSMLQEFASLCTISVLQVWSSWFWVCRGNSHRTQSATIYVANYFLWKVPYLPHCLLIPFLPAMVLDVFLHLKQFLWKLCDLCVLLQPYKFFLACSNNIHCWEIQLIQQTASAAHIIINPTLSFKFSTLDQFENRII